MPWSAADAQSHTSAADTPARQKLWSEIANRVLAKTGDEGRAIREANAVVGTRETRKRRHRIARWL